MKLKLADVKKNLPFKIHKGMATESLSYLKENFFKDVYDVDVFLPTIGKNLQRPFVWSLLQQQEFILSILKGMKIANISWIQYKTTAKNIGQVIYKIIDGKQRFTTIMRFLDNEFPLNVNGVEYFFKDLDDDAKYEIDSFYFTVDVVYEYETRMISDDDKIAWFEMINFAGTPQDIEHLNNLKN
jgi:uncharacterized protein with ParB-like and HNH nuclease domain